MSWVAVAVVGGLAVGQVANAVIGGNAAESAANTQSQAAQQGQQLLQQNYEKLSPYYQPYINVGQQGVSALSANIPYLTSQAPVYQQPAAYKPFTAKDLNANLAPNYEFMKQQGLGAVRQASNVGGGGSNVTRAATKFAEDYASNAYQNALNNYMTQQQQGFQQGLAGSQLSFNQQMANRNNIYNTLAGISNIGATGVSNLGNLATGTAQNVAGLGIQSANAQAAGTIGQAKAYTTGISNISDLIGGYFG